MIRKIFKNNKGITLVEVLVYITIFSLSLTSFVSFFLMINAINSKNNSMILVEGGSRFFLDTLGNNFLNSKEIIYPLSGTASSTLRVINGDGEDLKIFLDEGVVYIEESVGLYQLTDKDIFVDDLLFFVSGKNNENLKITYSLRIRENSSPEYRYERQYFNSFTKY